MYEQLAGEELVIAVLGSVGLALVTWILGVIALTRVLRKADIHSSTKQVVAIGCGLLFGVLVVMAFLVGAPILREILGFFSDLSDGA